MPAARARATGNSSTAGTKSAYRRLPHVVRMPRTLRLSFTCERNAIERAARVALAPPLLARRRRCTGACRVERDDGIERPVRLRDAREQRFDNFHR
jgi:hypothetical protein